jgi:serine/threonine protein kinase/tetratricopeptide (TPR) repeat protein
MKCPSCQTDNPPDSKFCRECATPLRASKPSPAQPIPPLVTETLDTVRDELAMGSLFAGRYQIIEQLGQGGMGRVYRALDRKLNEEVALKLVRPEIAGNRSTLERFHMELKLARKISHPHVGRMYELMEEKGAHFITMEYVPGQDLRGLIRQTGQLTVGKAIAIGQEICEGLAEAHKQGIIHRDLKPSNIIIDRAGSARIMDFGIARSLAVKSRTGAGVMIGTPEYMSPEQVEGKEVDQRSDIYSMGIILYEMVTGRVPFEGDTPFTVGVKHKSEIPKNPKLFNPHIPDDLSRVVLKCLEKDSAKRCQTASEVRAELEEVEKGLPTAERATPERKPFTSKEITVKFQPKKLLIPALSVVAIIVAAVVFWPSRASNLDPNLVAVAVFENKTVDPKLDSIGSMAADRIMQGLAQAGGFSVAPMPTAEALSAESKTKDKLRALAEVTRAGKIVHGDYFLQGENIQFHAWVQDVAAKKNILSPEPASGPLKDPATALEPLRLRLMGGLAGVFDPEIKDYLTLLKEPPNFEAFREFSEGLKAHNRNDYSSAVEHFLRAGERDPKLLYALGHAAVDCMSLGQYAKADELLQKAETSRADASNFERLTLDWAQAALRGDLEAGLRATRQLVALVGSQTWIFVNGVTAYDNNNPREAVAVLGRYDPYALPRMGRARQYWWALTAAHHMLGNHKQELKEARRGRKQLPENLSLLVREVDALAAMGRMKELQKRLEESKALPPQSGHAHSPGTITLTAGRELRAHGFRKESVQVLAEALEWFDGRPEQEKTGAAYLYNRGSTLYSLERWSEAKATFTKLHNDVPESIDYLGFMGATAARTGDREGAAKISQQLEEDKKPYLFGNPTFWRARIAALLGAKEDAVNLLRQATQQGVGFSALHPCEDFESLADYPPYIQLMKPKG